jgi:hypothetical protein
VKDHDDAKWSASTLTARTIAAGGWREKWTNARDEDNLLASDCGARLNDDYMSDIKVIAGI